MEWDSPRKEECIPGISLNAKQLYWLGFAMDWCTMGDMYEMYSNYRELLSASVVSKQTVKQTNKVTVIPFSLGPDIPPHPGGSTWFWRIGQSLPETSTVRQDPG